MIWPPDSPWAPWWRTSDENIIKALKLAGVKSSDVVYDLGSGDGRTLIIAAKKFGARGVGVEIDPLRFYFSKLLVKFNGLSKRVELRKENFLNSNISDATVVFVYLVPNALKKLKPKFLKNLEGGTRIVSIKYEMELPKTKIIRGDRNIYLYHIS
ncbi:MAG TPA: class I SAM-dependent methyltransferase [Patescibacteria group bacterium]|nr:class I SAM-dependent methyltransferase [Patescibacteria group bacterium]